MGELGTHWLVLGLGESGVAAARLAARLSVRVRVADSRANPPGLAELRVCAPQAELVTGPFSPTLLADVDTVVLSPGLSLKEPVVQQALAAGIPVVGEIELFARMLATQPAPVVAITGTNGKTTVTALTGHLVRSCGRRVGVAGNISPAALTAWLDAQDAGAPPDVWVLELSSYQLETTTSLKPVVATVLNVTEDHLDRYDSLDDYAAAKARIFASPDCVQVINRQDARVVAMAGPGRAVVRFGVDAPGAEHDFGVIFHQGEPWLAQGTQPLLPRAALPLFGDHNVANALAALALGDALGLPRAEMVQALTQFSGLPHRVEKIASIQGVDFFDDSKGTNVGATVAAIEGLQRSVLLIAGGDGKGQDFSPLAAPVARWVRGVALIGRDAKRIESALSGCGVPIKRVADMGEAVGQCWAWSQPGDAVVLSPACASLDMYRNYAHRAEVFAFAVRAIVEREEAV